LERPGGCTGLKNVCKKHRGRGKDFKIQKKLGRGIRAFSFTAFRQK